MRIFSPAKINLHLRVGRPAADGFHPLLSWMCTVALHDTMDIQATREPGIRLKCDRPDVPVDANNLIVRAAHALNPTLGAQVLLKKKIPLGGGLGGGSSNAASALIAFSHLWNLNLPIDRLAAIGSQLGSDVPFFLHGPSSVCTGRGEHVLPIPPAAAKYAVLFFPAFSMSTPAVYKKFDQMKLGSEAAIQHQPDWQSWSKLKATGLLKVLVNDLESPAFSLCTELGDLRNQIEQKISRPARMSGSGSTLFTLADDPTEAGQIAEKLQSTSLRAGTFELAPAPN